MSPFFDLTWWSEFRTVRAWGESEPPPNGWAAHNGGRNQLYLDMHADWVRRDIER